MSASWAGPIAIVAVLVAGSIRSRSLPSRVFVALLGVGAVAAIGSPELRGAGGFLVEPLRAWFALAVIFGVVVASLTAAPRPRRIAMLGAAATFVLLAGHAGLALAGLVVSSAVVTLIAWTARPWTEHGGIAERMAAPLLLAGDLCIGLGVLMGDGGATEPLRLSDGAALVAAGCALRVGATLGLRDWLGPVLLAASVAGPLAWIGPGDARIVVLAALAVAAAASLRSVRTGEAAGIATAWAALAVAAVALGTPIALGVAPLLALLAVVCALLPDVVPALTVAAAPVAGAAGLPLAVLLLRELDAGASDGGLGTVHAFLGVLSLFAVGVAAWGVTRPALTGERSLLPRTPLIAVIGGVLALLGMATGPAFDAISGQIMTARVPGLIGGVQADLPEHLPFLAVAAFVAWIVFERAGIRRSLPAPVPVGDRVHAGDRDGAPPDGDWVRLVVVLGGLAAASTLAVLVRSAMDGWL